MTGNALTVVLKKLFTPEHEWTREKLLVQRKGWAFIPACFRRRATVWDYIPENIRKSTHICIVRLNGKLLNDDDLHRVRPRPGDILEITPLPGFWVELLASAIVAIVLMIVYLGYEFGYNRPREERAKKSGWLGSTYLFDRFTNTSREGTPIPVIYGEHRVAGQYLQIYTATPEEGYDVVNALMGVCEGPICSITDFWINGTDAADLLGALTTTQRWYSKRGIHYIFTNNAKVYTRTGERDQAVIPGLENTVTSVSYNDLLLYGSAVTLTGTTTANKFKVKIQFTPYGLWYQDSNGHAHSSMFEYRYRYRSNGGAWGVWMDSSFNRRRREPFSYWIEMEVNATTAVTIDVQIERRSRDSDPTNGIYASAYVKEYQQVLYDDIRYVSTALYGFEAIARQKVCEDIPAFTALVQGMMLQEFLTGVRFYGRRIALTNASHAGGVRTYTTAGSNLPFITGDKVTVISTTDYPGAASNWSSECIAVKNVTGNTFKVVGTDPGEPIVGGYVCWPSKNPACVILDILFSRRYGLGNYIDRRIEFGATGASGSFTVGEIVTDADGYRGTVKACTGTPPTLTLIVESDLRFPTYSSTLTGATSGKTAAVGDIVEVYAIDIASFWNSYSHYNEWMNDGQGLTTNVDLDSTPGFPTLYVASTTNFAVGDHILIAEGTASQEHGCISAITAGDSFTLEKNLTYSHSRVDAHEVHTVQRRAECDMVFDGQMPAWEAIHRIASNAISGIWKFGSKLYLRPIKNETPIATISAGNIVKDSFRIAYPAKGDRPNVIHVKYLDKEADYADSVATMEDQLAVSQDYGITPDEHDCYGVTRREEALRIAIRRLKEIRYALATCEWDMDVDAIGFEPLDVVRVQSDVAGWGLQGGRVVSTTNSTITLDKVVTLGAGTYYIRVTHSDGTADEYKQITSAAGVHKTISIAPSTWAVNPTGTSTDAYKPDVYALGTVTGYQVRIMKIELREDLTAHITAIRDSASMYDNDIETVPALEVTSLPDPRLLPPDVTNVTLTEGKEMGPGGELRNSVDVSFVKPQSNQYNYAEIYLKEGLGYRDSYGWKLEEGQSVGNDTLILPMGVCTDGIYIYILDTGNNRILKLNYATMAYVAAFGTLGSGNDQFNNPRGICTDGTYLWISDTNNDRVVKMDVGFLGSVGGTWITLGATGSGNDQFSCPNGLCHDDTNNMIFVADTGNHRICKIDENLGGAGGGTWATFGTLGSGNDQFSSPCDVATDDTYIYVADPQNYRIMKITVGLVYDSKVGSQGTGANQFCGPRGICYSSGYLVVADAGYDGVTPRIYNRIMTRNASDLTAASILPGTVAEYGGYSDNGLDALHLPHGVAIDSTASYIFVADRMNNRVLRRRMTAADDWVYCGQTMTESFRMDEPFAKGCYYTVAVVAVSPYGAKKSTPQAPTAVILIGASGMTPRTPSAIYAKALSNSEYQLYWSKSSDPSTYAYEVRRGTDWETGQVEATNIRAGLSAGIGTTFGATWLNVKPPAGASIKYWLKATNSAGVYSSSAASVNINLGTFAALDNSIGRDWSLNSATA